MALCTLTCTYFFYYYYSDLLPGDHATKEVQKQEESPQSHLSHSGYLKLLSRSNFLAPGHFNSCSSPRGISLDSWSQEGSGGETTHFHPANGTNSARSDSNSHSGSGRAANDDCSDPPPPPSNLESTVARLVDAGIRNAMLRLQPSSNISLPSRSGSPPSALADNTQPIAGHDPGTPGPSLLGTPQTSSGSPRKGPATQLELPPIPSSIKAKIDKGEFIELSSLLQENMSPPPNTDPLLLLANPS